jgi:hypothetical protein
MTSTADTAQVTTGTWLPVAQAAKIAGRSLRTLHRWCDAAFNEGTGPLAQVRIRRVGDPWEVHEGDLHGWLATRLTPRQQAPTAPEETR